MDRFSPPPVPAPQAGMVDQAMGRFNPAAAQAPTGPDQAAQRAYTDAMAAGQDGRLAAKEAWKASAKQAADPNTPDAPGSENLRMIQQHLIKTKGLDPLTAWAIAHEALPQLAQSQPGAPAQGVA